MELGDPAPGFSLRDQNNQTVSLASFSGTRAVLLVFYPWAFSGVCSSELAALRDDLPRFSNERVQLLTVSVDSVFAHKVWAEREGYTFPLLSDFWPHGAVAARYGVFDAARGAALRGTFLIDTAGVIRYKVVHDVPVARNAAEYAEAIAALG